jgi:cell division protease FtsH
VERRIVAYHEVGHALVSALLKSGDPVSKITIIPHTTGSLGYTMYLPEDEKHLSSREELLNRLQGILGGRAAEEVVFGSVTNGASSDIQHATGLARHMVALYGMSEELGLMAAASVGNQYLDGGAQMDCSQETAALVDKAVKRMLTESYAATKKLLTENRQLLDEIAGHLLLKESITGEELMAFVNAPKTIEEPSTEESAE